MQPLTFDIESTAALTVADRFRESLTGCLARKLRTIREFAEDELRIPDGKHGGEKFRSGVQPIPALWWDEVGGDIFNRFAITGPTQSGKSYQCFVVPILYALFELKETTVVGVFNADMARDKWEQDLLPAIKASSFAHLLPSGGQGSRGGGDVSSVTFLNGATLRFMMGCAHEKSRAGFTARILSATEIDGMDQESEKEGAIIDQMESRLRSHDDNKIVFLECTVSNEDGRIWQEVINGTNTRAVLPCPHCGEYVQPERDDLIGWKNAANAMEAERAKFHCPECGIPWVESKNKSQCERFQALGRAVLLHEGQSIDRAGNITGDAKPTRTFSMRFSAVHNAFVSAASIGAESWSADRDVNPIAAIRKIDQSIWAEPPRNLEQEFGDGTELFPAVVASRLSELNEGELPEDVDFVTSFIDVGKRKLHYSVIGWTATCAYVTEYDAIATFDPDKNGELEAIRVSLGDLIEQIQEASYSGHSVDVCLVDSGNWTKLVRSVIDGLEQPHARRDRFCFAAMGDARYNEPSPEKRKRRARGGRRSGGKGKEPGQAGFRECGESELWFWSTQKDLTDQINVHPLNAKMMAQDSFRRSPDKCGAMVLHGSDRDTHDEFSKQICAEKFDAKLGKFVDPKTGKPRDISGNHQLDTIAGNVVARSVVEWLRKSKAVKAESKPAKRSLPPAGAF